ncbi:MAG TPA: ATP-binding protein, partial [Candidatus Hydrogenedentes bacterium]|nr:ATP-binding protein [Candidatus Hydrogenedentota bacterium]
ELSVTSVAKGAGPRVWLASCFPISSPDGVVVGVQMVVQDISELKHAEAGRRHLEQQMQQSQKLESLGVLAGGIAHDFNNLLTGILGNTSLALERGEVDDKTRALLEAAVEAARRAAELTQQMLAYAGQSAIKPRFLDVSRLIQDNLPLLRASVTKRAALTLACAEELSPIVADPIQVQQLVMNLATNASEALGEDSGRITICTGEKDYSEDELAQCVVCEDPWPGRYVYIEVADSGCGIDPEALPRIFEPFYSTKFAGRGLGLSVAVGIVRRHRGALGVESTPGGGTVFRVLFPAARGQVSGAPAPASAETVSWRGQGLVLVVDDEEMVRITAQEILEDLGFEVICAEDGVVAEGLFRQHRDRLVAVLLDLTMPGRSGADTYRAFASYGAAVPVVVCSGFSEDHALQQFEGERRVRFMHKPYAYDTVMRLMRKLTPSAADA